MNENNTKKPPWLLSGAWTARFLFCLFVFYLFLLILCWPNHCQPVLAEPCFTSVPLRGMYVPQAVYYLIAVLSNRCYKQNSQVCGFAWVSYRLLNLILSSLQFYSSCIKHTYGVATLHSPQEPWTSTSGVSIHQGVAPPTQRSHMCYAVTVVPKVGLFPFCSLPVHLLIGILLRIKWQQSCQFTDCLNSNIIIMWNNFSLPDFLVSFCLCTFLWLYDNT